MVNSYEQPLWLRPPQKQLCGSAPFRSSSVAPPLQKQLRGSAPFRSSALAPPPQIQYRGSAPFRSSLRLFGPRPPCPHNEGIQIYDK